ncbi:hypothetical protein GCM10020219_079130 [Nonomuraea dietziae]
MLPWSWYCQRLCTGGRQIAALAAASVPLAAPGAAVAAASADAVRPSAATGSKAATAVKRVEMDRKLTNALSFYSI